jgi:signal transduction histidine kinase
MIGIFGLMDMSLINDNRMHQLMQGLQESTFKLNTTLNDLIKILIIKENVQIEITQVYFKTVFDRICYSIQNMILTSNAIIETDFKDAPYVYFSIIYMESILMNLITNAIKYQVPGISPRIKIRSIIKNNFVQLSISDNGLGMDWPKVKHKVFGLYQKFHNNIDGKGIGLYLVHAQVNALGGTIELDTEIAKGSTFTITFKNKENDHL